MGKVLRMLPEGDAVSLSRIIYDRDDYTNSSDFVRANRGRNEKKQLTILRKQARRMKREYYNDTEDEVCTG